MTEFEFSAIKDSKPFTVGGLKTFEDVLTVSNLAYSAGFERMEVSQIDSIRGTITMSLEDAKKKLGYKVIDGTVPSEVIYTKEGSLRNEVVGYMQRTGAKL